MPGVVSCDIGHAARWRDILIFHSAPLRISGPLKYSGGHLICRSGEIEILDRRVFSRQCLVDDNARRRDSPGTDNRTWILDAIIKKRKLYFAGGNR